MGRRVLEESGPDITGLVPLRIMATTDLHMHILPFDYFTDRSDVAVGLARTATLIRAARAETKNSILVDNGDSLCGAPAPDILDWSNTALSEQSAIHPIVKVMNQLGYDACTLGNHDFDLGVSFAQQALNRAKYPVLSANTIKEMADDPLRDITYFPPYAILQKPVSGLCGKQYVLRIGIVGFLPPASVPQHHTNRAPILTRDIVETARAYVPEIRAQGADIVIALAHSGIAAGEHCNGMENAIIPLAQVDGLDAIIAGHSHQVFPGPLDAQTGAIDPGTGCIHDIPVVSAGFWGSHLGLIDLDLVCRHSTWSVQGKQAIVRPIAQRGSTGTISDCVPPDRTITTLMTPAHSRSLARIRKPIGRTKRPISSCFSMVAPSSAVQLVQRAQQWFVETYETQHSYRDAPLLSAASRNRCGGLAGPEFFTRIPAGELTFLSVSDLCYFPNTLALLRLSGAEVRAWLERSAGFYAQIQPGQANQLLKRAETPCYFFDSIFGVSYTIDLTRHAQVQPSGLAPENSSGRIRDLTFGGAPVHPDQRFTLITNSHRLNGGGCYPGIGAATPNSDLRVGVREAVQAFLRHHPDIDIKPDPHWTLASADGASVIFQSAPIARDQLDEVPHLDLKPVGSDPDGFSLFRLSL